MKRSLISRLVTAIASLLGLAGVVYTLSGQAADHRFSAEDYFEIQQLYALFNHALDTGRTDRYAALWVDDGEFTGGRGPGKATEVRTPIKGRQQLWDMADRAGLGARHFIANLVVTPTPDGAKASSYLLLLNARSSPPVIVETAIYDDTLVKTEQAWKFKKRINWRDDDDISPFKPKPLPPGFPGGGP